MRVLCGKQVSPSGQPVGGSSIVHTSWDTSLSEEREGRIFVRPQRQGEKKAPIGTRIQVRRRTDPKQLQCCAFIPQSRCRTPHRLRIFWALAPTETSKCRGITAHAAEQVEDHAATLLPRAASQTTNISFTLGRTDAFVWFVPRLGLESLVSVDRHRQHSTSLGPFNWALGKFVMATRSPQSLKCPAFQKIRISSSLQFGLCACIST